MQADFDDRITMPRKRSQVPLILMTLALIVGSIAGYWYWQKTVPDVSSHTLLPPSTAPKPSPPAKPSTPVDTASTPAVESTPLTPEQIAISEPPLTPTVDEAPLPLLDDSDAAIKTAMESIVSSAMREPLSVRWYGDNLLRRFVSFVANVAEGKLDSKSSPLTPPKLRFAPSTSTPLKMTPESHARFNTYIQIITSINPATCAATYRRHYPLLQSAYADLGEKKTFHTVMLAAIDQLLAAPEPTSEPELIAADKGLFKFSDPQLEALPAAQKPLLRMGRENEAELKQWLRRLRSELLTTPGSGSPIH